MKLDLAKAIEKMRKHKCSQFLFPKNCCPVSNKVIFFEL